LRFRHGLDLTGGKALAGREEIFRKGIGPSINKQADCIGPTQREGRVYFLEITDESVYLFK